MKGDAKSTCGCLDATNQLYSGRDRRKIFNDEAGGGPSRNKLVIMNESSIHYCIYAVDGGLLKEIDGQKSCDLLLKIPQESHLPSQAILVELKGNKYKQGLEQLRHSLQRLHGLLQDCSCLYAVVVSSSGLNIRDPDYLRLRNEFMQKGCKLLPVGNKPISIPQPTPC
ncbi:MAG: hypothetical protein G8345_01040 [Magnetococcales bacterium]|nr:hypothetical protein [Magnetococcales bacterium]NGZ25455.1 hypothetical protein [Magnetococcales bacterium]